MPYKKLSEFSCKKIYYDQINVNYIGFSYSSKVNNLDELNFLKDKKLVCKVDVGEKRRGNNGLII